ATPSIVAAKQCKAEQANMYSNISQKSRDYRTLNCNKCNVCLDLIIGCMSCL
uniref:Uncharacterized protein n=1 Tax=Amphimedon queenslandica TaxID=400682 RepID=A0A1X7SS69_AMPQE